MAREAYLSTQSIHDMTTRQLREYIYQNSREAEERMKTIDLKTAPKALQDQARLIVNDRGKVKKSTSNLRKEEMVEMAYALRDFNMLDVQSKYARDKEWESSKTHYIDFIRKQSQIDGSYWKKYIVDGEVSKEGFAEYKMFVNFLRQIGDAQFAYGYDDVVQWIEDEFGSDSAVDNLNLMVKVLTDVYKSAGGISQGKLIEKFKLEYANAMKKRSKKTTGKKATSKSSKRSKTAKKTAKKVVKTAKKTAKKVVKTAKKTAKKVTKVGSKAKDTRSSSSKISIKQGRKMKESGTVRERPN